MAKQRYGINDAYRGTVGTVIGYEWRGRWCLRARPLHVHNPRTAKQQSNRLLFKQMVALASNMKIALRKGLRKRSMEQHMTECNQFVKYNKECFSLDTLLSQPSRAASSLSLGEQQGEQRMIVDWEKLIISEGSVVAPVFEVPEMMAHPALQAPLPTGGEENRGSRPLPTGGVPQRGGEGREKDRGSSSTETHAPVRCASTPSNLEGELVGSDRGSGSSPNLEGKLVSSDCGSGSSPNLEGELVSSDCDSGSSPKLGEVDARSADGGVCISIPFLPHAEGEQASGDDEVYLYAYCPEAEEGVLSAPAYRKSKSVHLTLPDRWQGKNVHLYAFAMDYRGDASTTEYLGCIESTPVETQRAVSQNNTFGDGDVKQTGLSKPVNSAFWAARGGG